MRLLAVALVLTSSAVASAGPLELGAGVGLIQSSSDASAGNSSQQIDTLFGRLRVLGPLAAQVEIGHMDLSSGNVRTLEGAAVVQFGHRWQPFALLGVAMDSQNDGYATSTYTRIEAGIGLDFHITGGLVIGADIRDGNRDVPQVAEPLANGGAARYAPRDEPSNLAGGDYRTIRLTLAISL